MASTPPSSSEESLREDAHDLGGHPGPAPDPAPGPPEPDEQAGDGEPEPGPPERVRTGSERVDEVIRAVEELEERPLEEHVGVFESAQVQLRRALDDPDNPHGSDDHPGHG